MDWNNVSYIGYDVVRELIAKNILKYSSDKIKFYHENFLNIDIPKADLLICKDVFGHLPDADIIRFIKKLKNFKFCLLTHGIAKNPCYNNIVGSHSGLDSSLGGFRLVDLSKKPFKLKGTTALYYHDESTIDNAMECIKQVYLVTN